MLFSPRYAISGCILLAAFTSTAQTQQKLNIEEATVFLSGAQLSSTAKVSLGRGENEILFTNVAGDVNTQSITVGATNDVVVESVTFQNNYLASETLSPRAQQIKDSIELLKRYKQQVANKITVHDEQIAILKENRKVSGNNSGLSVAELTKLLDLINTKLENYLNQKNREEDTVKKTDDRITRLSQQLDEEQKRDYLPGGQLLVKFYAKDATSSDVAITYATTHAGWSPTYDVIATDASSPMKIYYKANIYQNSGVKWNNVKLSLSTGNPRESAQVPVLSPWYLAFYAPVTEQGYANALQGAPAPAVAYKKSLTNEDRSSGLASGEASMNQYVSVDDAGINTTFDIDLPYTIPSDGQQHLVAVKKYDVPATYRYYAIPKMDKDAFLEAQVTNWEDLNLLPGQTSIFYEGTYIGHGYIDVRNVKDTMLISLGRDKKIVVRRERDTKLRSVKTIGTNVRETFAYSISVRNTRRQVVNLTVLDQMPVSNDKDIVIEDRDNGGADYNETTGTLKWELNVNANETKKLSFGYTVKYPRGKTIANLR